MNVGQPGGQSTTPSVERLPVEIIPTTLADKENSPTGSLRLQPINESKRFRSRTTDPKPSESFIHSPGGISALPLIETPDLATQTLLPQFIRLDIRCRQQRLLLNALKEHQQRLMAAEEERNRSASKRSSSRTLQQTSDIIGGGGGSSKTLRTKDLKLPFRRSQPPSRVSRLFAGKPKIKQSPLVLLHQLRLAVLDGCADRAERYLADLPRSFIRKRYPFHANIIFLISMANRMEKFVLLMLDKGFPKDCNQPIMTMRTRKKYAANIPFQINSSLFPSYFMAAIAFRLDTAVRFMIKLGANINQNWCGLTPLHLALISGPQPGRANYSLLATLLEFGADPWSAPLPLSTLSLFYRLRTATEGKDNVDIQLGCGDIADHPKQASIPAYEGLVASHDGNEDALLSWSLFRAASPLAFASANGDKLAAAHLLLANMSTETANTTEKCQLCLILLLLLAKRKVLDLELMIFLLKSRLVDLKQTDPFGANVLHLALRLGDDQLCRCLLYYDTVDGDLINSRGQRGWTALHEAISCNRLDLFRLMLRKGANGQIRNDAGDTPRDLGLKLGISLNDLDQIWFGGHSIVSDGSLTAQPSQSLDRIFSQIDQEIRQLILEPRDVWLQRLKQIVDDSCRQNDAASVISKQSADQRNRLFQLEPSADYHSSAADSPLFYTPAELPTDGAALPPFASGMTVAVQTAKRQGTILRPNLISKMFSRRKRLSLDGSLDIRKPTKPPSNAVPFDLERRTQ